LAMPLSETAGNESFEKRSDTCTQRLSRDKRSSSLPDRESDRHPLIRPCENSESHLFHGAPASDDVVNARLPALADCGWAARFMIWLIRRYQGFISPALPPACRFHPTCSEYGAQSLQEFGFFKGMWRTMSRLMRCHPFNPGGFDPVR
jgi:putative membrane protein insertion efficiency factor